MLKKRLIFTLLYDQGQYMLSRNFRLQEVGDLEWLKSHYNFDAITFSIDELIVLNVSRSPLDIKKFSDDIIQLSKNCFLPIAVGGGLETLEHAYALLNSNADKLVVNRALFKKPDFVSQLARQFGSQCVIASLDCKKTDKGYEVFTDSGSENTGKTIEEAIMHVQDLGAGEIYLTSIDRDGTGFGCDLELLERAALIAHVPLIISGGVGKNQHFLDCFKHDDISAVSTANIYNFIVDGLMKARRYLQENKVPLVSWNHSIEQLRGCFQTVGAAPS